MWLKDFLPSSFPKARIMAFNHNSAWNMNAPAKSVEICGSQLLASLNTQRQSPEVSLLIPTSHCLFLSARHALNIVLIDRKGNVL